jgi:hypothetical protein
VILDAARKIFLMLLVDGTGFASRTWVFRYSLGTILECGSLLPLFCLLLAAVAMRVFVWAGLAPPLVPAGKLFYSPAEK